jgi:hypothetical protein
MRHGSSAAERRPSPAPPRRQFDHVTSFLPVLAMPIEENGRADFYFPKNWDLESRIDRDTAGPSRAAVLSYEKGMIRRSLSCMCAGTLAATGLDLLALLVDVRAPIGFAVVAAFIAVLGLLWLGDEIADGSEDGFPIAV